MTTKPCSEALFKSWFLDEGFHEIVPNNLGMIWENLFLITYSKCYFRILYPWEEHIFFSFLDSCIFFKNLILILTDNPEEHLQRTDRKVWKLSKKKSTERKRWTRSGQNARQVLQPAIWKMKYNYTMSLNFTKNCNEKESKRNINFSETNRHTKWLGHKNQTPTAE